MSENLNKYEGMFLLNNSKVPQGQGAGIRLVSSLLEKRDARIKQIDVWDERKLAYPIEHQKRGTYVLAHFEAPSASVDLIHRDVNITEGVMRALILRHGRGFPPFPKCQGEKGGRREEGAGGAGEAAEQPPRKKAAEAESVPEKVPAGAAPPEGGTSGEKAAGPAENTGPDGGGGDKAS